MRPPWKSRSCDTCRKRKVKCDGEYPVCSKCSKSSYNCQRRYQKGQLVHISQKESAVLPGIRKTETRSLHHLVFKMESIPKSPSHGCLYRTQLLSSFLTEFMPSHSTRRQTFSYFEDLRESGGKGAYVNIGSSALSLVYLGQIHGDKYLIYLSLQYYKLLLQRTSTRSTIKPTENVIIAAAFLSMYEVYNPLRESSWSIHVRAACKLIASHGLENIPIDLRLLCFVRTLGFYDGIGRREATLSANPQWDHILTKNEPFEQLLSIVLALPRLEWAYDKIEQTASAGHLFLVQFTETYSQLRLWYLKFLFSQNSCCFKTRAAEPDELSFVADYPELKDIFTDTIMFSDRYTCQLLLLCWTGFFVLNYEALKFMRKLKITIGYTADSLSTSCPQHRCQFVEQELSLTDWSVSCGQGLDAEISRAEKYTEVFSERICQSIVYADKHTNASAMKLILINPLWMLQQYYLSEKDQPRSLWCLCALQAIPPQKMGFSSLLTRLSIPQYQALGNGTC